MVKEVRHESNSGGSDRAISAGTLQKEFTGGHIMRPYTLTYLASKDGEEWKSFDTPGGVGHFTGDSGDFEDPKFVGITLRFFVAKQEVTKEKLSEELHICVQAFLKYARAEGLAPINPEPDSSVVLKEESHNFIGTIGFYVDAGRNPVDTAIKLQTVVSKLSRLDAG